MQTQSKAAKRKKTTLFQDPSESKKARKQQALPSPTKTKTNLNVQLTADQILQGICTSFFLSSYNLTFFSSQGEPISLQTSF